MTDSTIEELLSEPIIRKLMARDGVRAEEIRALLDEARARGTADVAGRPEIVCPPLQSGSECVAG